MNIIFLIRAKINIIFLIGAKNQGMDGIRQNFSRTQKVGRSNIGMKACLSDSVTVKFFLTAKEASSGN